MNNFMKAIETLNKWIGLDKRRTRRKTQRRK